MRQDGWVGEPIEVFQAHGQRYVVNGHHRVAAARQAGIDVQYRVISEAEMLTYYPSGVNQLVSAASEPGEFGYHMVLKTSFEHHVHNRNVEIGMCD